MQDETSSVTIGEGIPEPLMRDAAELYYEGRLKPTVRLKLTDRTRESIVKRLNPAYALSAVSSSGALVGFAAVADHHGGFWRRDGSNLPTVISRWRRFSSFLSGSARSAFRWRSDAVGTLLLEGVFVVPGAVDSGIGERLLDETIANARHRGLTRIEVYVEEPNAIVKAVYERHGFVNETPHAQYNIVRNQTFRPYTRMALDLTKNRA